MKSLGSIIAFTLIVALVGAVIYFVYHGTLLSWNFIAEVELAARVIMFSAFFAALLIAFIIVYGLKSSASIQLKGYLSQQRYDLYVNLITTLRALLDNNCSTEQQEEFHEFMSACNADFLMLASGSTVKAYLACRQMIDAGDIALAENFLEVLWKKMRKDLGVEEDFEVFNPNELKALLPDASNLRYQRSATA